MSCSDVSEINGRKGLKNATQSSPRLMSADDDDDTAVRQVFDEINGPDSCRLPAGGRSKVRMMPCVCALCVTISKGPTQKA